MNDITAPQGVEINISRDGKVIWVNVEGSCVLRCCRIGQLIVNDGRESSQAGKDYYFCYHDGEDHCQGFHITPMTYFENYGACADWHLTAELEKIFGDFDARFVEVQEGCFEFEGLIEDGRRWLLDHGFVERPDLLP